ncbi:MAG: succinate dehydrogenase [Saprospiraceae bacterium]|nr:MAG: succinate dehydrogenase [Saprospiraceae bacterium]
MSLTGLFLISFLVIHLIGNLQLLIDDEGEKFNLYAEFMTTNPVIKTVSYLLYFSILLHAVQGWMIWRKNRAARGQGYAVKVTRGAKGNSPKVAKAMGWIGTVVFIFLLLHLYQFWFQMKLDVIEYVEYNGESVKDLYSLVSVTYEDITFVIIYVLSMAVIAFHLLHGFQSAFQTLGLNHKKYTPFIKTVGTLYAILIPLGFAIIPLYMYFLL